ncbi:MAG: hypothetical protein OXB98_04115 [Bryobacterales bacterium]|nr:hypothetical protein [Bryobacterales bacterium]
MAKFRIEFRGTSESETIEAEWVVASVDSYQFQKNEGRKTVTLGLVPIEAVRCVIRE